MWLEKSGGVALNWEVSFLTHNKKPEVFIVCKEPVWEGGKQKIEETMPEKPKRRRESTPSDLLGYPSDLRHQKILSPFLSP